MTGVFFILGVCQALFLWYLGQSGFRLLERARREREKAVFGPPGGWPVCSLIIPAAGSHPNMRKALESLCSQDYPDYETIIVVEKGDSEAGSLAQRLADFYPRVRVASAERAENCGQKNMNLLTGVEAASPESGIYAFCDCTHYAAPDFLRCLVWPVASGESAFSAGYHQVEPKDSSIITLAYAITVLFMRFMQGMSGFTQLWGGAMCMTSRAFHHYRVGELWAANVVDDCSLTASLMKLGVKVQMAPAALLLTPAAGHSLAVLSAWLKRQILFLKFCMPGQWLGLGVFCLFMLLPPVWGAWSVFDGLIGEGSGTAPFLALCWLCCLAWALLSWRGYFSSPIPPSHWLLAFFSAIAVFSTVYARTIFGRTLVWHKNIYEVGKNGVVKKIAGK